MAVSLVIGPAAAAGADPLVVGGSNLSLLALDFEGDFFFFRGNGFDIGGSMDPFTFIPRVPVPGCGFTCAPGEIVNLALQTPGEVALGSGRAIIGGTDFGDVAYRGQFTFTAPPVTFPSHGDEAGGVLLRAPFEFTGTMRGFSGSAELFAVSLVGRGNAFTRYFESMGTFVTDNEGRRDYVFRNDQPAPTPEPATLLLTVAGAAGLWRARRA